MNTENVLKGLLRFVLMGIFGIFLGCAAGGVHTVQAAEPAQGHVVYQEEATLADGDITDEQRTVVFMVLGGILLIIISVVVTVVSSTVSSVAAAVDDEEE